MADFAAQVDIDQVEQAAGHEVGRVDQVREQLPVTESNSAMRLYLIEYLLVALRTLVTAKADSVNRAT